GDGMVRGIRTGQYTLDTARVVLDLAREVEAQAFVLPDPYRLVVDLRSKGRREVDADPPVFRSSPSSRASRASPPASDTRSSPSSSSLPSASLPSKAEPVAPPPVGSAPARLKVVIDPGHGGKDPGARGWHGLEEKDVVLAIATQLADELRADGVDVAMTRSDDRFLALEERTGFANAQGADLFISVHANASTNPAMRGVEVYYLNNTDNRGTLRLAAMENNLRWDPHDAKLQSQIPDLSYILSDLRQTYKVEESKELAEDLQQAVVSRLGADYERVEDLGVKEGPFYVLVGAYMPCVLVEVSFLTNGIDGARLGSAEYRSALADGIHEGIRRYIAQTKLAKTL
ncbi:MAG TPA: N-acetylmuramoyl-L-alanine amidase, partial [Candidatus Binatia bacterium]|nr:N-acetylmuramoyl-L-alanine amidase [Candidatus Binatia bacterium]